MPERPSHTSRLPERRRPVHHPPVRRHNEPVVVFVTLCITPRIDALANAAFLEAFKAAVADADAWSVGSFLIMPDHVHLFCSPAVDPPVPLKRWARYLKGRITKRLNGHTGWKWQNDCWDTQIRSSTHYTEKWQYVRQNPVRRGLVRDPDQWPYHGVCRDLRW